jgi:hypothetical protein
MPLFFDKRYLTAILRGEKTKTLRRWKSPRLRAGTRASVPSVGQLNILSWNPVKLKDLTEEDTVRDDFGSLRELFKTLHHLYPNQRGDGRKRFRVVFSRFAIPSAAAQDARMRVVREIRADLDKAVRET